MSLTADRVAAAAAEQEELLATLTRTDGAQGAVEQADAYIKDLRTQHAALEREARELELKAGRERRDFRDLQESTLRRYAYRLGGQRGKFEAKAAKEQREWFEAMEAERAAKDQLAMLAEALEGATAERRAQQDRVDVHDDAQARLDDLYQSLFDGPTPQFPDEDAEEANVREARAAHAATEARLAAERQAVATLQQATRIMAQIQNQLHDAHTLATLDMWGGGLTMDMMEQDSLSQAQMSVLRLERLLDQAGRLSADAGAGDVGAMGIARGPSLADVLFNNPFSDYACRQRIDDSRAQLDQAACRLDVNIRAATIRTSELEADAASQARAVEAARARLMHVRANAVRAVMSQGTT